MATKKKLTKAQMGIMTTPQAKSNSSGQATQNNGPVTPVTPKSYAEGSGNASKAGATGTFKKGGIKKMKAAGTGPCAENETYINGRCVKMNFFNSPAGIAAIGAGLTGIGAAIKKKIANKKEAKIDAAQFMKDIKSVSSKSKMKVGGMVNSNKKISVTKTTTRLTGGISKAPKTAIPKAKYGMSMSKMGSGGPTSNDMSTMSAKSKTVKKPNTPGSNKGMIATNPIKKMGGSTKKKGKC